MKRFGLSEEQQEIIRNILLPYAERLERVGIFGSRAVGTERDNSDVDLVLYGSISESDIDRIWTLFDESALPFKVDVSAYNLVEYVPLKRHIDKVSQPFFHSSDLSA